jgi:Uma2 family endonuclease
MIAAKGASKSSAKTKTKNIPASFIYEIIDGEAIFYKGTIDAVEQGKTVEEIMGSSTLQSIIIEYLLRVLFRELDEKKYHVLTNEQGLHLNKRSNLSADITIYEKSVFSVPDANKQYATLPPKVQIEVDLNIELINELSEINYINKKTNKLFQFGVEKVVWVLSSSKKVIVAQPNENWQIIDWHKEIEILDGVNISIGQYLQEHGSPYA